MNKSRAVIGYSSGQDGAILFPSGQPVLSREKNFPESQIIKPLLTKLFRSRWVDAGLVLVLRVFGP